MPATNSGASANGSATSATSSGASATASEASRQDIGDSVQRVENQSVVPEQPPQGTRVADEVRLVEARFELEIASLQRDLEAANKRFAEAVANTARTVQDVSSGHEQAFKDRLAEEVHKVETRVSAEKESLEKALADATARADEAAKRLLHVDKRPVPSRSNNVVLLSGSIALLAIALLFLAFRPHPHDPPNPARYALLEQQLSDAHDAANGYQVRIAALEDQIASLRTRLKNDDKRVETLRSELAGAQSRPAETSDPSQAATIRSLRNELATEKDQLKAARTAFVNVQHSRDEALTELAKMRDGANTTWPGERKNF